MNFDQWNEALSKGPLDQAETSDKKPDRFYELYGEDFEEEEQANAP